MKESRKNYIQETFGVDPDKVPYEDITGLGLLEKMIELEKTISNERCPYADRFDELLVQKLVEGYHLFLKVDTYDQDIHIYDIESFDIERYSNEKWHNAFGQNGRLILKGKDYKIGRYYSVEKQGYYFSASENKGDNIDHWLHKYISGWRLSHSRLIMISYSQFFALKELFTNKELVDNLTQEEFDKIRNKYLNSEKNVFDNIIDSYIPMKEEIQEKIFAIDGFIRDNLKANVLKPCSTNRYILTNYYFNDERVDTVAILTGVELNHYTIGAINVEKAYQLRYYLSEPENKKLRYSKFDCYGDQNLVFKFITEKEYHEFKNKWIKEVAINNQEIR